MKENLITAIFFIMLMGTISLILPWVWKYYVWVLK